MDLEQSGAHFETTQWTIIEALREPSHPKHEAAQDAMFRSYWPPVYAWFRRHGQNRSQAVESTQAFYVDVLLSRAIFQRAQSERGGLRQLIRTALRNYTVDQSRSVRHRPVLSLQESELAGEDEALIAAEGESPERAFDLRWAAAVLRESISRCERHYQQTGRMDYWRAFESRVLRPLMNGGEPPPLTEVAADLGFTDAAHAAVAVHTVKSRCQQYFDIVVRETVVQGPDHENERILVSGLLA